MSTTPSKSNWEVTTNRYVAYFDIMGFKDMVFRNSHNDIYEMMKKIDRQIMINANINWSDVKDKLIKTTTYSDSIIIYSKDDNYNSFCSFAATVASLTHDLLTDAIPHKGAVAFGIMTLDTDNSIFFGRPLIDAYLLQEELTFYGIIVHSSFEQEIFKKNYEESSVIKRYLCNLKNGNAFHYTIGESVPRRHPIPVQVGTLIRNMPAGDSGASRQVLVI